MKLKLLIKLSSKTIGLLEEKIQSQISRTRTSEEKSPKNTALYFSILQETKDLMKSFNKSYRRLLFII